MFHLLAIFGLMVTVLHTSALAQTEKENWAQCLSSNPDVSIKGCTVLIDSQGISPADLAIAYYSRGIAHLSKGEYEGVIEDDSKSLQLKPANALALYARSVAKEQMLDTAGAAADKAAARKIDPQVADKVVNTGRSSAPVAVSVGKTEFQTLRPVPSSKKNSIPDACVISPNGSTTATYADELPSQLKKYVPALRGLKFDANQDQSAAVLNQTGAVVAKMLSQMPNLSAKEEVKQIPDSSQNIGDSLPTSSRQMYADKNVREGGKATDDNDRAVFSYRIVAREDPVFGHVLDESRTDQMAAQSVNHIDHPHSVGFGVSWLIFFPNNLEQSRFRLLGTQKIGNRETYVFAFAQIPDRSRVRTVVESYRGPCSTFTQGVAWIDQSTFRIVRMQTDLLSALPDINLKELRSTINYGEVRIPEHNRTLWLPGEIEIAWKTEYRDGGERHRYSNYKLYEATSRVIY